MNTKQLRQKILDLAIRGKLVPQDPTDEPASVLLERVRAEKERLIKEGKIKRDKKDSTIIRGDDKSHYEQLPDGWVWCRLSAIATFAGGKTPSTNNPDFWNGSVNWVTSKDMKSKYIDSTQIKMSALGAEQMQIFNSNTLLIVVRSGILRRTLPLAILRTTSTVNQDLKAISYHCYESELSEYCYCYFSAIEQIILTKYQKDGTTVESINFEDFKDIEIPLPPLAESRRIVSAIESAFAVIGEIECNKTDLQSIITVAKSKVLSLAICGKLVPQDPNDEPASVLLERIRIEREVLIKAGKIKRDKSESTITRSSDNSYYEKIPVRVIGTNGQLPDGWVWAKLDDVANIVMGQSPSGDSVSDNATGTEFHQGKIFFTDRYLIHSKQYTSVGNKITDKNSVLLCVRAPVGTVNITKRKIAIGRGLCALSPLGGISVEFLFHWLTAFQSDFISQATGTTFIAITTEVVRQQLIPIPPITEQHRIVVTIENSLTYLNEITKNIN